MQYTYYRFDASKLTLAEVWRCSSNVVEFCIAAICKLFGINVAPPFGAADADRRYVELPITFGQFHGST